MPYDLNSKYTNSSICMSGIIIKKKNLIFLFYLIFVYKTKNNFSCNTTIKKHVQYNYFSIFTSLNTRGETPQIQIYCWQSWRTRHVISTQRMWPTNFSHFFFLNQAFYKHLNPFFLNVCKHFSCRNIMFKNISIKLSSFFLFCNSGNTKINSFFFKYFFISNKGKIYISFVWLIRNFFKQKQRETNWNRKKKENNWEGIKNWNNFI